MGKGKKPRCGSRAFKRNRVKRAHPRVNYAKTGGISGFAAYKLGMTHIQVVDNAKESLTSGEVIMLPVTILEAPELTVYGIRGYKQINKKYSCVGDVMAEKIDKNAGRNMTLPKKHVKKELPEGLVQYSILVHTNPPFKKTPEMMEIDVQDRAKAKELLGKKIKVTDVFKEGEYIDAVAITTGKGFQGTVKRFGVSLLSHKQYGCRRKPGALGTKVPRKVLWTVPRAGQMGFQKRTDLNKRILKIGDKPEEINAKGGFIRYGLVNNPYILIEGSVPGPRKRLICLRKAIRLHKKVHPVPEIVYLSKESKQGV